MARCLRGACFYREARKAIEGPLLLGLFPAKKTTAAWGCSPQEQAHLPFRQLLQEVPDPEATDVLLECARSHIYP